LAHRPKHIKHVITELVTSLNCVGLIEHTAILLVNVAKVDTRAGKWLRNT